MGVRDEHCLFLENGKIGLGDNGIRDLSAFFSSLRSHPHGNTLVVHFHGGLVSRSSGVNIAKRLTQECYEPAAAYPLFFIWESHPLETICNNLEEIAKETLFRLILKHVSQFAQAKLEDAGPARGPWLELPSDKRVWEEIHRLEKGDLPFSFLEPERVSKIGVLSPEEKKQFEDRLRMDRKLAAETEKIAAGLLPAAQEYTRSARIQGSSATLMSPSVLDEIRREASMSGDRGFFTTQRIIKGAVAVLVRVTLRFVNGRHHGFFPTIVEEILRELYLANAGKYVWDLMKGDTEDAFMGFGRPEAAIHGGTSFLRHLSQAWNDGYRPRIVLVGHSTGAIFICNLLKAAEIQGLPPEIGFETLFLAPAVRFDLFADTLAQCQRRISQFRTFGMCDELEQSDRMLGLLYPRSLLYFVSGLLEPEVDCPLIGMQRYYAKQGPFDPQSNSHLKQVFDYLDSNGNRCVWSICNRGTGLASNSCKHGDFDDDSITLSSLKSILAEGF